MELMHAAILLHEAGKEINESNLKGVLNAAGVKKDDSQLKALVAALEGVNIDEAIKESAIPVAQPAQAAKKEEVKEEKKEHKQEASVGLGALFG